MKLGEDVSYPLEMDLDRIERLAKERLRENSHFRYYLKGGRVPDEEINEIVLELNREISSRIDCTKCANCCSTTTTGLDKDDIEKLSDSTGISSEEFIEKYLYEEGVGSQRYMRGIPCPFLNDKYCEHYDSRPKDCREYPHLEKGGFTERKIGMIERYSECPIVFNVIEQLKIRLGYRYRER